MNSARPQLLWRSAALLLTAGIGVPAVVYFFGIYRGVPQSYYAPAAPQLHDAPVNSVVTASGVMPAATYSQMRQREAGPTSQWKPDLAQIPTDYDYQRCVSCHDPHSSEVQPNHADKLRSLAKRATRRAFNGAPPVVPHAVERTEDAACFACHGQGARIGEHVANRMSHGPLSQCLQCHAAPPPKPFAQLNSETSNTFRGLPAPPAGERAFPSAPPVIPHSTWMREQCLSCHGLAGWPGLEVTHRWRTNCLQCHAPSAQLEQTHFEDDLTALWPRHAQQP